MHASSFRSDRNEIFGVRRETSRDRELRERSRLRRSYETAEKRSDQERNLPKGCSALANRWRKIVLWLERAKEGSGQRGEKRKTSDVGDNIPFER